jgi:hypothetical protein
MGAVGPILGAERDRSLGGERWIADGVRTGESHLAAGIAPRALVPGYCRRASLFDRGRAWPALHVLSGNGKRANSVESGGSAIPAGEVARLE